MWKGGGTVSDNVVRLRTPPVPTLTDPTAQIRWIFYQLEAESGRAVRENLQYARGKYLEFLKEANAGYEDLQNGNPFYLVRHWEPDALLRFSAWLNEQELASKTKYGIYKSVRSVMDLAYGLRFISAMVYHAPMFKGVSETDERAAYTDIEQGVINAVVARWIGLASQVVSGYIVSGAGIPYRSMKSGGINVTDTEQKPYGPQAVVVAGKTFSSLAKAAEAYGVKYSLVRSRLRQKAAIEQVFGLIPFRVPQSDERALLWAFENEYACDAKAMMHDFHVRKLGGVCNEKRMRVLFARWGVWPYVDDRLVMPLAVELAMLTALNVESIKDLTIDCYHPSHPLTGQPVLYFYKKRAEGAARPGERALHLPLLEKMELHLNQSQTEKVARLISLILSVTSKIRHTAGEFAKRLFIFEDTEQSRKTGTQVIVPIDPKGKAGHWYARFMREECLREVLGESFSFNIARCRPTAATNLLLSGASIFQVQAVLDHKNLQTTVTYLDERQLTPVFNQTVSDALASISHRSAVVHDDTVAISPASVNKKPVTEFAETLSGCGCGNPYDPSKKVREKVNFKQGSVCKYWNMCLFCDRSVITERGLPKLILYRNRVSSALEADAVSIRSRKSLYGDVVQLIDAITSSDGIFPSEVVDNARVVAASLDDVLVDQLVYQGL